MGCGFELSAGPEYCARGARRSAPRGKRSSTNDICFRVDMTRHSSSCFRSTIPSVVAEQ